VGIDRLAMIMTNQPSIQDVLFFPQMRPETREKSDSAEAFATAGVPETWYPVLIKLGYTTVEKLKAVKSAGKLHQDLCGYNKKNKLQLQNPTPDEVKAWSGKEG